MTATSETSTPRSSECPIQVVLAGEPIDCAFPRGHVPPHSWAIPAPQGVTRWRKKPVTVEAIEWTGANLAAIRAFATDANVACPAGTDLAVWNDQEAAWIPCPVGHSVVKGCLGELYPVSPAAIAETYEPADGDQVSVSREDLATILGEAEGFVGGKDNGAFTRLAEAAGVE